MKNSLMQPPEKLPNVDAKKCNKCNMCIEACPVKAILESSNNCCAKCIKYCMAMDVPCNPEYIVFDYEKCDSCGLCVASCHFDAISWFDPKPVL